MSEIDDLRARLLANERLAALGLLTAGIAHEIKNPLNFVGSFADLSAELCQELGELLPEGDEPIPAGDREDIAAILADLRANLEKVQHHARRADRVVRAMLDQASDRRGGLEPADLNQLVVEAAALAYHGLRATDASLNAHIEKDLDPAAGSPRVHAGELTRAVLNLANNALHAMHAKRRASGDGYHPTLLLRTRRAPAQVEVMIEDNGPGLPGAVRERLFEPFVSTKAPGEGTGLGLSIARRVVEDLHGGTLAVESTPGEGTRFILAIPTTHED